jgi:hypothetical protein
MIETLRRMFMRNLIRPLFGIALFVLIMTGLFLLPCLNNNAAAQVCEIEVCKSAVGAGDTLFRFTADNSGDVSEFGLIAIESNGACALETFNTDTSLSITEDPLLGWQFDHVECVGLPFTLIDNGVQFTCPGQAETTLCTFFNVPGGFTTNVPTLSEWGMLAAAGGLMLIGVFFAVRRRKAQTV